MGAPKTNGASLPAAGLRGKDKLGRPGEGGKAKVVAGRPGRTARPRQRRGVVDGGAPVTVPLW